MFSKKQKKASRFFNSQKKKGFYHYSENYSFSNNNLTIKHDSMFVQALMFLGLMRKGKR